MAIYPDEDTELSKVTDKISRLEEKKARGGLTPQEENHLQYLYTVGQGASSEALATS